MKQIFIVLMCGLTAVATAQQPPRKIVLNIDALYTYDLNEKREFYAMMFRGQLSDSHAEQPVERFEIQKVNLADYFTKTDSVKGYEPFNRVNSEKIRQDSILYFFSGFSFPQKTILGRRFEYHQLFPGQSILVGFPGIKGHHHFYSTGRVVPAKDTTSLEVFEEIKNYTLAVRSQRDKKFIDQTILKMDMRRWEMADYLGGIFLNWMGDLDGDGELDIIFTSGGHHECYDLHLFSLNKKGWVYEKCTETVCGG